MARLAPNPTTENSLVTLYEDTRGGKTVICMESPIDLKGLEIEVASNDGGIFSTPLEGIQLYDGHERGISSVGIFDIMGKGNIPASKTETIVLEIPENATCLSAVGVNENGEEVTVKIDNSRKSATLPREFKLYQNRPNPYNPSTIISYDLPREGNVKLEIFNLLGQKVTTLVDEFQSAGHYEVEWNSTDAVDRALAGGMYFYRLSMDGFSQSRKMLLLK